MRLGALLMTLSLPTVATSASAASEAEAIGDPRRTGVAVVLHLEPLGGPVGALGLGLNLRFHRFASMEIGAGISPSNVPEGASAPREPLHLQLSAMLRVHLPAGLAVGAGYSEGYYRSPFGHCDGADGNCRFPWGPPPRGRWMNLEVGGDFGSGSPWRHGFAIGIAWPLNRRELGIERETMPYVEYRVSFFVL